jgi:hypothetical protein
VGLHRRPPRRSLRPPHRLALRDPRALPRKGRVLLDVGLDPLLQSRHALDALEDLSTGGRLLISHSNEGPLARTMGVGVRASGGRIDRVSGGRGLRLCTLGAAEDAAVRLVARRASRDPARLETWQPRPSPHRRRWPPPWPRRRRLPASWADVRRDSTAASSPRARAVARSARTPSALAWCEEATTRGEAGVQAARCVHKGPDVAAGAGGVQVEWVEAAEDEEEVVVVVEPPRLIRAPSHREMGEWMDGHEAVVVAEQHRLIGAPPHCSIGLLVAWSYPGGEDATMRLESS